MTERALELLILPDDTSCYVLDVGCVLCVCRCGSGLSGEALTEAGHHWVGIDIRKSMLSEQVDE